MASRLLALASRWLQSDPSDSRLNEDRIADFKSEILHFANAEVHHNSRFSSVVIGRLMVIANRAERAPWSMYKGKRHGISGGIVGQHGKYLVVRKLSSPRKIPEALYVGTRSPGNWYHWIANTLPAICAANFSGVPTNVPIILPSELQLVPQVLESLELFIGDRTIEWISEGERIFADSLVWSQSPVYDSPYSLRIDHRKPHQRDNEVLSVFRQSVLSHPKLNLKETTKGGNYYLARLKLGNRIYNQEELLKVALHHNFTPVYLDTMSFRDQVGLFQTASVVVGPVGASFANLLFASKHLKAVLLSGPIAPFENFFPNLASVSGARVKYLIGEHQDRQGVTSRDFWINPADFEDYLCQYSG